MAAPCWPPSTTIPVTETGSATADHWIAHHGRLNTETHPAESLAESIARWEISGPIAPADRSLRRTVRALDGGLTEMLLPPHSGRKC